MVGEVGGMSRRDFGRPMFIAGMLVMFLSYFVVDPSPHNLGLALAIGGLGLRVFE